MSVILEFTIDAEGFQLGRVLSGTPRMQIELERIVPTGDLMMPFLWATGEDHEDFEEKVRNHPDVRALVGLDAVGESSLYRIEWERPPRELIDGIAQADATVLEARGDDDWIFRLRFTDHDRLSSFHNYVIEHGIDLHIDRTYTLRESNERGYRFGLSQEQHEALLLGLRRVYFDIPSRATLEELSRELGITKAD